MEVYAKPRVLLIEGNTSTRLFFSDVFWLHTLNEKFELYVAESIEKAEVFLGDPRRKPDIVFLDLVLPTNENGRTKTSPEVGLHLISRIKNDPTLKQTKIIIYSSYPEKKYGALAKKNGADLYIHKAENLPQDILDILHDLHTEHFVELKKRLERVA